MKIQLESYKVKYTIETENDDLDIFEYMEIFLGLLVQSGFTQESVNQSIIELAESLKDN